MCRRVKGGPGGSLGGSVDVSVDESVDESVDGSIDGSVDVSCDVRSDWVLTGVSMQVLLESCRNVDVKVVKLQGRSPQVLDTGLARIT